MTISVGHEAEKRPDLPYEEIISDIVLTSLDYEECPYEAEVDMVLMDNDAIQEVNRERRCMGAPTDVLSFPMMDYKVPPGFSHVEDAVEGYFNPETEELILGSIVIPVDKVEEQADKCGHSQIRELASLVAHSMLRPYDYDHMEGGEREQMEKRQKKILETRGYAR